MMMNLTCGGRGCYRFGVWKNVKPCPRHPALSTIASAQLPLLHLANGDTKLHNLAMVSCAKVGKSVQVCSGARREGGEVIVQRRHVVHVEARSLQCQWQPATLLPMLQALHRSQMWILKDVKTLRLCCMECISMHFKLFRPCRFCAFFLKLISLSLILVEEIDKKRILYEIAYQVHHFQWCCLPWLPPLSPPPWPPPSPAPPSPSEPARPPHRHECEVEPSSASSGLAQQGYLHVPGSCK